MEVLWLIEHVKSGLQSFVLEISCWTMLHGQVDQLKLIAIKSRHWEQSTLYQAGGGWHTQNIQINKVIGENEKRVFYFTVKNYTDFFANPVEIKNSNYLYRRLGIEWMFFGTFRFFFYFICKQF